MKKEIPGYEGLYSITDDGRVINDITYRVLKCSNSNGYRKIALTKNKVQTTFKVHRLVAASFIPNPDELPQVDHKDEDRTNIIIKILDGVQTNRILTGTMKRIQKENKKYFMVQSNQNKTQNL